MVGATTGITFATDGPWHSILLAFSGVITAVPLLLFAESARRLALVHIGFVQFFTPILQFLLAVFILHENMPPERLFGFALVWVALVILSVDLFRSSRSAARLRANAELPV